MSYTQKKILSEVIKLISNINHLEVKNCKCNGVHIRQRTSDIDLTPSRKEWHFDSILLAKFNNDLEAGNVGLGGLTIDQWKVRRRRINSTNYINLDIIESDESGNFQYIDRTPTCEVLYEYEVIPMSGDIEGQPHTIQIECKFDYWWLTDGIESYPFFANLEVSDIPTNIQRYVYEGFDVYPTISYGNLKYKSGTITAILLDINLATNHNYHIQVENFINNRKPKYLRNANGDNWLVDTSMSRRQIYTQLHENVSALTFDFTQIGDELDA